MISKKGFIVAQIYIHQIYYNPATQKSLDAGFIPLDNMSNERPDWFEFWPIRRYLLEHLDAMDENDLYGFFSPKFGAKLGLSSSDVYGFIQQNYRDDVDVFVWSHCWDQTAFFRNVFEQGDYWHKGLMSMASEFFKRIGQPVDLTKLVTHSQNTAFSNNIVAKPKVWRRWLALTTKLFDMAENAGDDFEKGLSDATFYLKNTTHYPMKIFIQERLTSFLLATEFENVVAFDTFSLPGSMPMIDEPYCLSLLACDAYKQVFSRVEQRTVEGGYYCLRKRIEAEFVQRVL